MKLIGKTQITVLKSTHFTQKSSQVKTETLKTASQVELSENTGILWNISSDDTDESGATRYKYQQISKALTPPLFQIHQVLLLNVD